VLAVVRKGASSTKDEDDTANEVSRNCEPQCFSLLVAKVRLGNALSGATPRRQKLKL